MGQVFLGTSAGGRQVAVKLIRPELAGTARFRERFAREAAAARQVGGFHTAQVVDADPGADPPWLATAFVPGPTLQQLVDSGGPLYPAAVLRLGAGIAEGLAAIHRCGLVHRDLKPGNVIVAEDGPRIIDFGIAHESGADAMTRTGSVIGTYAYMSPEQVRGEALSPAGDVFAFGSVLAFAATGRSPFDASSVPAIVHRVVSEPPRLDGLDAPLHEMVGACLAKDPAQRPGMDEVLARLSVTGPGMVSGAPAGAFGPAPGAEPAPRATPTPTPAPGATPTPTPASASASEPAPGRAFHALPTQPAAAPPGAPAAGAAGGAGLSRRTLLLGGAGAAAAAVAVPAYLFRDSWWGSGSERDRTRPVARLEGHSQSVEHLAFGPDGRTLAAAGSAAGELWLWDTVTRRKVAELGKNTPRCYTLAFSPDGRILVGSCEDGTLRRWDARTREPLPALSGFEASSVSTPYSLAVSPDGAALVAAGGGTLQLFDLASGRRLRKIEAGEQYGVLFTPDGRGVATGGRGSVRLWEVDGGGQPRTFTAGSGDIPFYSVLISPDGKTIGGAGPGVQLWDRETGRPAATLTSPHRRLEHAAYRPGHSMIVGGGFGLGPDDDIKDQAKAATGGTLSLWDLKTGRIALTLRGELEKSTVAPLLSALAVSPDGKTLAAAFSPGDSTIQLWQLA